MDSQPTVSDWIKRAKIGDDLAVQQLWDLYFERLIRLARKHIGSRSRRAADEEDIALAVFDCFVRAAQEGRFPSVADRDGLWRVLMKITARKVLDEQRRETRQKRGGGQILGESALGAAGGATGSAGIDQVVGNTPTPEFSAMLGESFSGLLEQLEDADLRRIALAKLEGCTNREIADRLDCALRTVERRLRLIRKKWEHTAD